MPPSRSPKPAVLLPAFPLADARDELNLAEFPITLLSDRQPNGVNTLEFQDVITDPQSNTRVTRKLTISVADKYGLPTAKDDEVLLALVYLTRRANNFTDRKVPFSRYEIVHLLGWPDTGQSYRRVEESLDRWCGVYLDYEKAWWDKHSKSWVDEKFHVLDRVTLYDAGSRTKTTAGAVRQPTLPLSSFVWNEVIFKSMANGYLKGLDLDFYLSLTTATAKRLYRFLDKHFYRRSRLEFDLHELAFEHVGLSRGYQTGVLKQKLSPAITELESLGFLEPVPEGERYRKLPGQGGWRVVFGRPKTTIASQPDATVGKGSDLVAQLTARGVTAKTAAELVAKVTAELVMRQIDVFDWKRESPAGEPVKNPGGWLVTAIEGDYTPPPGYEPKDVRERKAAAVAETRRKQDEVKQRRQAAERQREEAETAARQARAAHIDGYLAGLSAAERAALETRAVAAASPDKRAYMKGTGPLAEAQRRLVIEDEVLRVCPIG